MAILLASTTVSIAAPDKAPVTGKWKIHSNIAGNENDSECTLTQTDNDIAGTCKKADGGDAKAIGKVDGAKVSWSFDSEYNGSPLTLKYAGTLDPATGKIAGTVTVEPFNVDGDFTATLSN